MKKLVENWPDGGDRSSLKKGAKTFADNHNGKMPGDESWWYTCVDAMKDKEGFDKEASEKGCSAFRDEYLQKTTGRGKDEED